MHLELVIRGGTIVNAVGGEYAGTVGVANGKIAAIIDATDRTLGAEKEFDATGKYVLPGCIDPHTHLGYKRPLSEDLGTETRSAAISGVTSLLIFHRQYGGRLGHRKPWQDYTALSHVG